MRTVAKGTAGGRATSAQRDGRLAGQIERLAVTIDELDGPFGSFRQFQTKRAILAGRNLYLRHGVSQTSILRHCWIDFIRPGEDAASQIPELAETGLLQEADGI